jgi:hypothetical protein
MFRKGPSVVIVCVGDLGNSVEKMKELYEWLRQNNLLSTRGMRITNINADFCITSDLLNSRGLLLLRNYLDEFISSNYDYKVLEKGLEEVLKSCPLVNRR